MNISPETLARLYGAFIQLKQEQPDVTCVQIFVEEAYISTLIDRKTTLNSEPAESSELGPEWHVVDGKFELITVPK